MSKNYMNEVAKLLGVELNEEFKIGTFLNPYKLTEQGLFFKNNRKWEYADATLSLNGNQELMKFIIVRQITFYSQLKMNGLIL